MENTTFVRVSLYNKCRRSHRLGTRLPCSCCSQWQDKLRHFLLLNSSLLFWKESFIVGLKQCKLRYSYPIGELGVNHKLKTRRDWWRTSRKIFGMWTLSRWRKNEEEGFHGRPRRSRHGTSVSKLFEFSQRQLVKNAISRLNIY